MRKGLLITVLLLMAVLVLAACGGGEKAEPTKAPAPTPTQAPAAPEVPAGDAAKGKELYASSCSACHGPDGKGIQGLGKDLTASEFVKGLSDAELLDFIKKGRDTGDPLNTTGVAMPPKGGNPALSDEQIMDIIAFIRSIHQ